MNTNDSNPDEIRKIIQGVLLDESNAIQNIAENLPDTAVEMVQILLGCSGRVIVTGMGKMSAVARKTAATLSSVGTPAIFLHPGEALHGDLGIVSAEDVLLALSNSGETQEILDLIPFLKRQQVPVLAITQSPTTSLANLSECHFATGVFQEADSITNAPTNSTTATLACCDSLAIALVQLRGFTAEQFAANHPGGQLGRKLLLRVSDVMATGESIPLVLQQTSLRDAIVQISEGKMGAGFIIDTQQQLLGILTDGDLRRVLQKFPNPLDQAVGKLMTLNPRTLSPNLLAVEGLAIMNEFEITVMPVIDENRIVGGLHMHELLKAGLG